MPIPNSSVPTAKAALLTAIRANATISADTTIDVVYDEPAVGDNMKDDIISVGNTQNSIDIRQMVGSGGQGWLMETFTLDVVISVTRGGDQAQTVFERCYTLINAVNVAVRTDPTLAGAVLEAHPAQWETESVWTDNGLGRVTVGRGRILCNAQS